MPLTPEQVERAYWTEAEADELVIGVLGELSSTEALTVGAIHDLALLRIPTGSMLNSIVVETTLERLLGEGRVAEVGWNPTIYRLVQQVGAFSRQAVPQIPRDTVFEGRLLERFRQDPYRASTFEEIYGEMHHPGRVLLHKALYWLVREGRLILDTSGYHLVIPRPSALERLLGDDSM